MRRLPVYLVIETSDRMRGSGKSAIEGGIQSLHDELCNDPQALETVYLSVITFGSAAIQETPLTELMEFTTPRFNFGSNYTSLGSALKVLSAAIDHDVVKSSITTKGDWRPIVLLFIAGDPHDDWMVAAREFTHRVTFVILQTAPGQWREAPELLADVIIQFKDLRPDLLKQFFKWTSSSVRVDQPAPAVQKPAPTTKAVVPSPSSSTDTELINLLVAHGADLNSPDANGQFPLHTAVRKNDLSLIRLLLERSVKVNAVDRDGNTALHLAVESKNVNVVKLLLEKGADANALNVQGQTPLHLILGRGATPVEEEIVLPPPPERGIMIVP